MPISRDELVQLYTTTKQQYYPSVHDNLFSLTNKVKENVRAYYNLTISEDFPAAAEQNINKVVSMYLEARDGSPVTYSATGNTPSVFAHPASPIGAPAYSSRYSSRPNVTNNYSYSPWNWGSYNNTTNNHNSSSTTREEEKNHH